MSELENTKIIDEMQLKKFKQELLKSYSDYTKTLQYMVSDVPISMLNLPKSIENILLSNGFLRVYDLINVDFTKIKGLGDTRIRHLTASLDQFFSMF